MKSFKQYFFEAINGPKIIMIGGPGADTADVFASMNWEEISR
jgi:hypothetical protein